MTDHNQPDATQRDNISTHLLRAYIKTSTSAKTGNEYHQLVQEWNRPNGKTYKYVSFLNEEQKELLADTVPVMQSNGY